MLYIENNNIQLTRGDTAYLTVNIIDDISKQQYKLQENDKLEFTVDYVTGNNRPIIKKQATADGIFYISPEDTSNLSFRKYVYDVQLTTADGDVFTIVPPSEFRICEEVTQ